MSISLDDALSDWVIREYKGRAISKKRLTEIIFCLYKKKCYGDNPIINIRKKIPSNREYSRCICRLEDSGVISPANGASSGAEAAFYIINTPGKDSPLEMICSVFPYGYISYMSAMSWYGITDRIPKKVYFTALSRDQWKERSIIEISERIDSRTAAAGFIPLYPSNNIFFGRDLSLSTVKNMIEPKDADGGIRIQDIGDLFIDMMRSPEKCGGEDHVIDVFMEYSNIYKRKIITRTNRIGTAIDKARIGFMLHDVIGIDSEFINLWKDENKNLRGGSRKLFSSSEFSSFYSEDWNISINIKSLEKYGKISS